MRGTAGPCACQEANTTDGTCVANRRAGRRTRACVSQTAESMNCGSKGQCDEFPVQGETWGNNIATLSEGRAVQC